MAHQKACGMDWKGLSSQTSTHLAFSRSQFLPTTRSYFMMESFHLPPNPKAFSSLPPSAMYIREPKITIPRQRLNMSTYSAFVDCCTVRAMTWTGATNAGLFNALKIRVRRMRRSTTNAPPSVFTNWPITPGRMAARSMRLDGAKMNLHSRVTGDGNLMGSKPTTMLWSSVLSKISDRTAQHVKRRKQYSMTKSIKQTSSIVFQIPH
mmetsp:Transcript_7975/g.20605  ORF Transcript_7975/g.20605 Transcript_7975/m.20605 type:complete len:207 (+) Transcript_7975:1216-1836(+)